MNARSPLSSFSEAGKSCFADWSKNLLLQCRHTARSPQRFQDWRAWNRHAFHLLEFELVRPRDYRTPDQLVEQNDYSDHRDQAPEDGSCIAVARSSLQIRTESGQTEVAFSEYKHLASHQEEPSACDRNHRVPHQADSSVWEFKREETLQSTQTVDARCFM